MLTEEEIDQMDAIAKEDSLSRWFATALFSKQTHKDLFVAKSLAEQDSSFLVAARQFIPKAIEQLRQSTDGQWISVEDRLPEKTGGYLCSCSDGIQMICTVNVLGDWTAYLGGQFYGDLNCDKHQKLYRTVTHWMNLPSPPKP